MPTSVAGFSPSHVISHSATPRRVQYLRDDGGGGKSVGVFRPLIYVTIRPDPTKNSGNRQTMAENLLRETWTNLDSHDLRLLLDKRIGGPGQYDGRDTNPDKLYLPRARASCRVRLTFRGKRIVSIEPGSAFDA